MDGIRIGFWEKTRSEDLLQYLSEWTADEQGRPPSPSLPLTPGNQLWRDNIARDYSDNLLPDDEGIRERLAVYYQSENLEPSDFLAELGKGCIGAIQLLNVDEEPTDSFPVDCHLLSEADITTILRNTVAASLSGQRDETDDLHLSIAGAQEETVLLWHKE